MRMQAARLLLLIAAPWACRGDEPRALKVDVNIRYDHVELAPVGVPPTFAALTIPRVVDPKTGKPYDRSIEVLGIDPANLRRVFRLESAEVLLGEPVLVEFRIEIDGPGRWDEPVGGSSRGLGRDGRYFFLMRHRDGTWVPDIFEGHELSSFGGPGGFARIERGRPDSSWHAVQQWCAIDRPGVYDLHAFHFGGVVARPVGLRRRVEAALTEEMRKRFDVDEDGRLVDREARDPPRDLFIEQEWKDGDDPAVSPIARSIPADVKAKLPGAAWASDYAHFTLTVRRGDDRQRHAMVERWTRKPVVREEVSLERAWAAATAMALARQDDFLPELRRRLRGGNRFSSQAIFLGLAMRDDPRAIDMLFEARTSGAIEVMRFLRPPQVTATIPRLIDRLTDEDHLTRAAAEEMLRRWTGQEFGHTWEGYDHERPTLAEGRAIQALYRSWWGRNQNGFRPRFR